MSKTLALIAFLFLSSCNSTTYETLVESHFLEEPVRLERPAKCQKYLRDDPGEWNPETDEYPPNHEWENCMGVGRER